MPRGFAEIYSSQTKIELFSHIEKMLSFNNFYIEHPDTRCVQVWNEDGDMLELSKDKIIPCVEDGMLITFWSDKYDSISIIFNEYERGISSSILLLDGFDTKESENLFNLITSFIFLQENNKFKGFVFDRREVTEGIDCNYIIVNDDDINSLIEQSTLEIVSGKNLTVTNKIKIDEYHENNAYIAIKKQNSIDIFELGF